MIVPEYWAEARRQHRRNGKQITVRRFGWSDISTAQAETMAESRAEEALQRAVAGQSVLRREPKVAYNGAQGVPIREEILARQGDVVITRNAYGARCLNSPDVLFADIDFRTTGSTKAKFALFFAMAGAAALLGWHFHSWATAAVLTVLAMFLAGAIADTFVRLRSRARGGPLRLARARIVRFVESHPAWSLRVYRTPSGLRVLATHQPFQPSDAAVQEFFSAIDADPLYVRMCLNQQCFRARLSAKPWRIGVASHMKPRPGVWPVRPERLRDRARWVAAYESRAADFAACTFLESLGSGVTHPKVDQVLALHDAECRATVAGALIA